MTRNVLVVRPTRAVERRETASNAVSLTLTADSVVRLGDGVTVKGRIKEGLGTLIGNAGEYYVVAELLKRGVIAALAPRNAPGFDVLATQRGKTVKIRVKTKSEAYHIWQWAAKKDGTIFTHFEGGSDFTVLVNLAEETRNLAFFIVPTELLNGWLAKDFQAWLEAPGKKGPHSPNNRKRNLDYRSYAIDLESYKNNWNLLWQ